MKKFLIFASILIIIAICWAFLNLIDLKKNQTQLITREGVVTQIQKLNRLQTVAYNIDTIIKSEKQGNWYALWQDQQKGLFVAHGRVNAGIDLAKISPEMVVVHYPDTDLANKTPPSPQIDITLPPSEIFDLYLDDIEIYDWQTGLFGMLQADPNVLAQAQKMGKQEILSKACQGGIMQQALDNATPQLKKLFEMTGAQVNIHNQGAGGCFLAPNPKSPPS